MGCISMRHSLHNFVLFVSHFILFCFDVRLSLLSLSFRGDISHHPILTLEKTFSSLSIPLSPGLVTFLSLPSLRLNIT